jgi:predicted AAA+ superfamily ATPase
MSYAQLLNPRPEVLSDDGIEGIIDLANLTDRKRRKIESKPAAFLSLTYPTSDIVRVIQRLNERFTKRGETPALFLFEGLIPTFDINSTRDRLVESYPFHPDLLTLILERVPARGGFQNIRGSLGFLANLVRFTYQSEDLVTAGHATLLNRETAVRLQDLDPGGDLINRVKGNMEELANQPLGERLASTTVLYTLTGDGRMRGATREDLIRHVMLPGSDINDFEQTLLAYQKYGSHFHCAESRYYFDNEENADAKVEFRSLTIDPTGAKARTKLRAMWTTEVFRETESTAVFTTGEETKAEVETLRKDRLRFVLAPRRLKPEDTWPARGRPFVYPGG